MVRSLAAGILFFSTTFLTLPAVAAQFDPGSSTGESASVPQLSFDFHSLGTPSAEVDRPTLRYFKDYLTDTGKILTSPTRWDGKDWLKVGGVVAATSSLFLIDQKVKNFAQGNQSPVASKFAVVGNTLGNGLYTAPALGAFYLYGHLADDHKARRTSLLALESFAISGLMTSGIKMLAERHRPNSGDSAGNWDGPHVSLKNLSFSSGHTASAFSIATIVAEEYKNNPYVPPLAYGLATLTGLSRIYSNAHWSSDAFFGAALGYFVSKAVLKLHKDHWGDSANRLTLLPSISKEMTGLNVKYEF